jgi:UDP-glucose 4-epimerase
MKPHVLITGATGLVGPSILDRALHAGYPVTAVSRRETTIPHQNLRWIVGDIGENPQQVLERLPQVDHVIHAAAAIADSGTAADLRTHRTTNMAFTELLFDWCGDRGVKTVVYISGFNLLRVPPARPVREDHPIGPATPYGIGKYWGELALARYSEPDRYRPVSLRLSSPIPFQWDRLHDTVVKKWIAAALHGRPIRVFGQGNRTQDFVAAEDVARGVLQSLESPSARGVYNLASGTSLSMRELAGAIASFRNTPITYEGKDVNEDQRWEISIDKARADFGYQPRYSGKQAVMKLAGTVL